MCYATNKLGSAQDVIEIDLDDIQNVQIEKEAGGHNKKVLDEKALEEMARKELESFKRRMESELGALRNVTARMKAREEEGPEGKADR